MRQAEQDALERIVDAVRSTYVFADKADRAAEALIAADASGELSGSSAEGWAAAVTRVLQELGRGTVYGEPTRGGAHPRIGLKVAEHLELALPVTCPRSPRSGRNWEGTGVSPDVPTTAGDALARACDDLATGASPLRRSPVPAT